MNPEEDLETERRALFAMFNEARRDGVKLDLEVLQEGRPSGTSGAIPLRSRPQQTRARRHRRNGDI
jgi:hypothetical protein